MKPVFMQFVFVYNKEISDFQMAMEAVPYPL